MMDLFWRASLAAAERGWIPDRTVRWGIHRLCKQRLREAAGRDTTERLIEQMRRGPVAPVPEKANEQHYEVSAEFFEHVLGPHLKYSCCFWDESTRTLEDAECRALEITCSRAQLEDGQDVLELGCGWGSLSLWMARQYPASRITAVSNSASQRAFIEARARELGLRNLEVLTRDINDFDTSTRFDRVVSVEMFEHMRNYEELLRRVSTWMRPDALMLVHIFCHQRYAYEFETAGAVDWMGRHFFTGGIMPSRDLLSRFQNHMRILQSWSWNGTHYQKTALAWLQNLDVRRDELLPVLSDCYGPQEGERWFQRWRIFFTACEQLWGFGEGREWMVAHYLLAPYPARHTREAEAPDVREARVPTS